MDGSCDDYFRTVCDYVHLNPVRARLSSRTLSIKEFRWNSFPKYLKPPSRRVGWLRVDRLLGEYGFLRDPWAGRNGFERSMEERRFEAHDEEFRGVRRSWFFGDKTFRDQLLEQMSGSRGVEHFGEERREVREDQAQGIIAEELRARGGLRTELKRRAKLDEGKVAIALRQRSETTVTFDWIAENLKMGSRSDTQNLVYAAGKEIIKGNSEN